MKNGWNAVAQLGPEPGRCPHILIEKHGWCMRFGPSDQEDEKYYSSLLTLLPELSEQLIRRRDPEEWKTATEMRFLVVQNIQETKELDPGLERIDRNLGPRLVDASASLSGTPRPGAAPLESQFVAPAPKEVSESGWDGFEGPG